MLTPDKSKDASSYEKVIGHDGSVCSSNKLSSCSFIDTNLSASSSDISVDPSVPFEFSVA